MDFHFSSPAAAQSSCQLLSVGPACRKSLRLVKASQTCLWMCISSISSNPGQEPYLPPTSSVSPQQPEWLKGVLKHLGKKDKKKEVLLCTGNGNDECFQGFGRGYLQVLKDLLPDMLQFFPVMMLQIIPPPRPWRLWAAGIRSNWCLRKMGLWTPCLQGSSLLIHHFISRTGTISPRRSTRNPKCVCVCAHHFPSKYQQEELSEPNTGENLSKMMDFHPAETEINFWNR